MNVKQAKEGKRAAGAERPFPWCCRHCGKDEVYLAVINYNAEVRLDGRLHSIHVSKLEAPICRACKKMVVTEHVDEQINATLRAHLSLLTPAEIRDALVRVGLSQKEAAERLGIAEETLSRWLNETQIQSRAMDNLLRTFFAFPAVRTALSGKCQDPRLGISDIVASS